MHNVSSTYNRIINSAYTTETVLQIGGSGDITDGITDSALQSMGAPIYGMDKLISMKTTGSVFSGSTPGIGSCVSRTISVEILDKDIQPIGRSARLIPLVRVKNKNEVSEWIPKGVFYVDTRKKTAAYDGSNVIELTGYDAMIKAEVAYVPDESNTDIQVVSNCADILGVGVDSRTEQIMDGNYSIPNLNDYSVREVLGFVGSLYAGNFIISDLGNLQLVPISGGDSD